jgi:hypothetical protein
MGGDTELVLTDPFQRVLISELKEIRLQVKRVADLEEKRAQGRDRLVECFKCQGKIRLRKRPQGGFDLFNADGSPHVCPKAASQLSQPTATTGVGTADAALLMNFLVTIWPKETSAGTATVTDCGDHWEIPSPRIYDRERWKQFAAALGEQFGSEYVSEPESKKYYFRIPKPRGAFPSPAAMDQGLRRLSSPTSNYPEPGQ